MDTHDIATERKHTKHCLQDRLAEFTLSFTSDYIIRLYISQMLTFYNNKMKKKMIPLWFLEGKRAYELVHNVSYTFQAPIRQECLALAGVLSYSEKKKKCKIQCLIFFKKSCKWILSAYKIPIQFHHWTENFWFVTSFCFNIMELHSTEKKTSTSINGVLFPSLSDFSFKSKWYIYCPWTAL